MTTQSLEKPLFDAVLHKDPRFLGLNTELQELALALVLSRINTQTNSNELMSADYSLPREANFDTALERISHYLKSVSNEDLRGLSRAVSSPPLPILSQLRIAEDLDPVNIRLSLRHTLIFARTQLALMKKELTIRECQDVAVVLQNYHHDLIQRSLSNLVFSENAALLDDLSQIIDQALAYLDYLHASLIRYLAALKTPHKIPEDSATRLISHAINIPLNTLVRLHESNAVTTQKRAHQIIEALIEEFFRVTEILPLATEEETDPAIPITSVLQSRYIITGPMHAEVKYA